ncbi:hypothetical protein [Paenibacillus yonginensis]|uniref:hypothetical protein n=1 Tax=Paenibacillus yonginensis TaxID=1462996 RepID=UPI0014714871|nr:hypothetical protein [Paenibacillus yonginensis]
MFNILDAGCGEGSHLNAIKAIIKEKKLNPVQAVGIDIKSAIQFRYKYSISGQLFGIREIA